MATAGQRREKTLWHSPKMRAMLEQPVGAPISLSLEEAREIVRLSFGSRPDLPPGKEFSREARRDLGQMITSGR